MAIAPPPSELIRTQAGSIFPYVDQHLQEERVNRARKQFPATSQRRVAIREFIQRVAAQYKLQTPILDIGSGYRSNEAEIWSGTKIDFYTLDIDPAFGTDFIADAADMSIIPEGTVGTCVCTELLEHVQRPQEAVSEMFRILQPGGRLVLTVPFAVPIHEKPNRADYWRFTPSGIRLLLKKFEIVGLQTSGPALTPEGVFVVANRPAGK